MSISLLLMGLSVIFAFVAIFDINGNNNGAYRLICTILLLMSFIRYPFVGTDSMNNYQAFLNISQGMHLDYGIGYQLYVKLLTYITDNYRFFLIVTASIILIPVFYLFRNCRYRSFAIILYSLSVYVATFDVLKGYLALTFVLLAANAYIGFKKRKLAILLAIVGFLFHPSIILFLGMLWISGRHLGRSKWTFIYLLGILLLYPELRDYLQKTVIHIAGKISSRYALYEFGNYYHSTTFILLYGFTTVLLAIYYVRLRIMAVELGRGRQIDFLINMHLIGQWLALFGGFIPSVNRYMKFGLIFSIMLLCECISVSKNAGNRWVLRLSAWGVYTVFVFLNNGGLIYMVGN